jgi:hypothetical protein
MVAIAIGGQGYVKATPWLEQNWTNTMFSVSPASVFEVFIALLLMMEGSTHLLRKSLGLIAVFCKLFA